MIKVHKNFRLFACMNPATDVGKKELPIKIRNRFTEFFIDECDDRSQLRIIVIKFNPFQSINRSIYEAFSLAFLSNLDQQSYSIVQKMIERIIFHNKNLKFSESIKNMEKLFPLKNFVIIENYPIIKGPNEPFIDDNYILTATVSKNLRDVCRIISAGRTYPILLQGETSVGKTSLIQWLAQATGNICHRVNNHEHTDLQEYIGSYCSQTNGKIIFKNGILIEAMKNGHWIILDELNLAPTEVLEALNRVLDENRECFIAETQELIKAHSRFLLFATQNPPGKYAGRKVLSRAFRNRFIELNFNEIPIDELEIILHKKCMIPLSYSKRMVSVLTQLQKCRCKSDIFAGKHGFITLRDLFRWGYRYMKFAAKLDEKIRFFDWNQFLANQGFMLLAGRVRQKDDVILIEEILEKIFKCKISQEELFYSNEKKFESKIDIFSNTLVWTNAFKRLGTLIKEAIEFEEPILLVGETGCGKTTICQYFSSINQKTLKIINCHMNTESSDFLGSLRPNRNACIEQNEMLFEWIDGPLVMAMKNGDYFLVDEISLADDSVLERLNSVLELERTIFLAENNDTFGRIKANKTFRYFATMNPGGDFGKKELSPALRDRFTEIWCPGFENLDDIYQIAFHNLEIFDEEIRKQISDGIRNFIQWFEQQIVQKHFIISVRDILSWTKFIDKTYSIKPQKLSLYDSFIHGAYLVYIDPFIIGNQSLLANKIDEIKIKLRSNNSSFSDKDQISIGPFSLPKLNQQKNSPENYYWQSNGVHNNCIRLMRALQLDKPILLEGSPGVGKTSLIQALSSICCDSLIRINLSDQTDISDLFGCDLPVEGEGNAGKFEFRDGPFLTALKKGLNACLDHRSEIFISELNKTFSVNKKQTRIFATQNPYSMDRSRKRLPKSFLNRFTIVYIEDLTDNDYYFILINMFPKISTNIIQRMISVNRKICEQIQNFSKKGSPFEFNLRDLIRWIQLFDKFQGKYSNIEPELFFNQIYTNKMRTIEFNNIDNRNIHYCFHQQFSIIESILICIEMNWLSILIGDSGIGKSHLIQLIANICGQQLNIIHANSEMDTIDLLGGFEQKDFNVDIKNLENEIVRYGFGEIVKPKSSSIMVEILVISSEFRNRLEKLEMKIIENHNSQDNGTFEWKDSSLVKSIQNGEWIVIENANLLNPAVLDRFNSLLEPDGCLTINEKGSIDGRITEIRPHQNFRLFFTMNPKYGELSRAMRNRGIEIVMLNENEDQLNSSMEEYRKILQEYGIPDQQEIEQMNRRQFFQSIEQKILKNQQIGSTNQQNVETNFTSSINQVSLLPKFNYLSNDSNLYYAIENYRLLFNDDSTADYSDSLKVRLFFENSTLADFNIRFRIFSKSNDDDYVKMISEKLVQISDDSKIFFNHHDDRFELVKKLPIDFHIQQRFQSNSFETNEDQIDQTKILILIKKFLTTIFERLNHLINKCRPTDDEILTIRETLIIFYQIFIQNQQSEKFIYEKFFPIWFLLNEKQIIFNNFIDFCNDSTVNEINQYFNISLFNEEKFKFVSKMCNNCFCFKSSKDLQAYQQFQKYLKILQHNPQQQQIPEKVTDSVALLDDYFNEKISYETATLVNKQCLTLSKLFSSKRYLDFYMNNESINSDDQMINSNNDPYEIFFNHFIRNGHKYTDLFVEILFNINRELNLSTIIQSLCANENVQIEANKFIISDKIRQNLTCEHIPLISIIYSRQMNNDNDSIEQFYRKKFTRKFFINFIYKNYFSIKTNQHQLFNRFVCLAEMFDEYIRQHSIVMADFIQNEKMKITTNPSELVECYRLILIGFTIANHTDPDYPIDPIIRLQTKLNDYHQQSAIIDEELKLRHLIYKQIYCEHNDESFNCLIFQKLQTKLNEFENQIEKLQKSIHYRQSFERYFNLIGELKQFKQTIFNWKNLYQIVKDSQDCFMDPNQQTIAKCLMYCQTINDFLKYLHENYQDYHDLIIPFETGILLVIKGLQTLIYRLQSRLNTKFLFHSFQSSIIRMLFDRFSKFVTTALPSELCSFIFQNNIIQILHKIYQDLNLKTNLLFQNLFQSISLDIQNSLYLREDNRLEILAIFFQIIDSFVNQFQKIEMKQDLDEIRKNALFHIRLDDYDNDNNQENIEAKVEELFPSFENQFDRFLDPFEKENRIQFEYFFFSDLNQNTLLFIARSHMQMIGLMEQPATTTTITNQMFDFVQSYLIRYKIIASILQKTMGFFDNNENIEQNLLDGHLLLMMKNSNSKNDSTLKTLNIYQSGIESQTEKCFSVLDNLRLKIEKDLLPEFENHPVLLKLLEIIQHVYEIKANSSLMCLATGLELILKTSEDWQLIAHRGISLVEYLNQITEILVEWRKMEINYWLKCLDMVSEKINEKELSIWWFRFYTIINDFLQTKQSDFENFKQFIDTVKKFIENSTFGQYEIRLKIIKVFIYYLKHSNLNTTIWIALENVYNFYNHFSLTIFKQISQEKAKIEKEIQEFVTISKWNPNNFWSLKASLSRSKKQLYGYVRKYEEYLSHPASKLFYFEKKLSSIERFKSLKIDLVKMIESDIRVKSKDFFETINDLEYFNIELIDSIDQYSNLKPTETKDLIIRKKQIAQIQNQKRRALSDLFRKLSKFGCRFRKGIFQFENGFNLNDTIFSEKSLNLDVESISFLSSNIESCNDYYYKSLSGYTMIVNLLEKPNQQLTLDMIDRIKGNIIHLTEIVDKQRKLLGKRMEQFNELNQKLMRLQKSYDPTEEDRIIADNLKPVLEMLHKFKNFILKFQSFTIRLNEILLSFEMNDDEKNFEEINLIVENVQQILIQIEPLLDVIIFTESRSTIVESSNFNFLKMKLKILENFSMKFEGKTTLLDSDKSSLAECNVLLKNILFCFEKIFKYLDNDDTAKTEEDKEKFIKHSINNVKILNLFNSEQIIQLVDKFFSNNFNQISIEIIKIFVPFFTKYIDLYKGFLCMSIGSLKTSSKLLHILMSLSSELLANGFCLPSCDDDNGNDEQQQQQKDQQKNIDNAGFDCLDSMEQSDEKSSKQQQQQQQSSSSQLNDGKLTSQNEQQQQINDDEEKFSMLKKKKNRSLFDENLDEHLQTKRQKITNDSKKEDDDDSKEEEEANRQEQTDLFRHVENKKKADNIAYDIDYGQQQQEDGRKNQKPLERDVNLNDDDDDQQNNMESNEEIVKFSNNNSNREFIMTSNVVNYQEESSFHTGTTAIEDQNQKMEIEDEHSMVPIDDTTTTSSSELLDNEFLLESEKRIEPLLYELCNQLQLVLEPTKRSKYKGDFKNGKRLNMRKVIAYVASQFRKDKIWLRRIKPNKRQYQILIAIDDSLSMSDNQSRMMAFDSLILLGKSLSIIESGLLSVVSFGEETRIVHSFGDPFTDQTINKIYNKLRFDQTQTKTNELLKCTASMFLQAKHLLSNSTSNIHQLLLIVSDGRGIFSEGESNIRSSIMRLKEIGVFTVFIIIDNPVNKNSILDIQIPVFDTDGTMKIQSYISKFPFSYYVILKDIHSLPMILGESLRQWLELIAYNG
ncbi:AAA ATPase midasin [Dermatophagoides pteronyssinus]|uniref:AAA ATPase midasin n=1 Tax=Dermatophagoides pteronyssinus TaxID=6956 RepID=A0ABQ8IYB8_DERPT|nr:AAA ATPase midasin [Dermatophagoides pteronyssinus]